MIKKLLNSLKYCHSIFSIFINPFFLHRKSLSNYIQKYSLTCSHNELVIDVGCGEMPYAKFFEHCRYIGVDVLFSGRSLDRKLPTLWFDGETIPIEDNSCSHVLLIEVAEHVYDPKKLLSEINRILISNGTFIITAPFYWPIHEEPYDFKRYTRFGLTRILQDSGFEIVDAQNTGNMFVSFFQTINSFLYTLSGKRLYVAFLPLFFIFNLLGHFLSFYKSNDNPFALGYFFIGKKC